MRESWLQIYTDPSNRRKSKIRSSPPITCYKYPTSSLLIASLLLVFTSFSKSNDSCRSYSEAFATSFYKQTPSLSFNLLHNQRHTQSHFVAKALRGGSSSLYGTQSDREEESAASDEVVNDSSSGGGKKSAAQLKTDVTAARNGFGAALLESKEEFGGNLNQHIATRYIAETNLPTDLGDFRLRAYRVDEKMRDLLKNRHVGSEPCVIYATNKPPFGKSRVPVRIHDQCFTSEVFRSQRCDCKEQLKMSLAYVQEHGGAVIYLQQEGRGIGLANKVAAYALQDVGMDTVDANTHLGFPEDCRQYGVVPSILEDMGIDSIQLMTNNPRKVDRLENLSVDVENTIPMVVEQSTVHNRRYLQTKQDRMNHKNFGDMLSLDSRVTLDIVEDAVKAMTSHNEDEKGQYSVTEEFITEGEEMASAIYEDDSETSDANDETDVGVTADESGYCFGRESVEEAIVAVARGDIVVVVDDMNRENEGDFIMAADLCTPKTMATIVRYSSGVICIGMEGARMDELKLPAMVEKSQDPKGTAFSVTVDAASKHGITTGISSGERAKTMKVLSDPSSKAADLVRPGHIFPLRAREGGVLARDGHTEAAVDLSRLAGRHPSGVLCEIVSEENPTEMARLPELKRFCKKHGFVLTSIVDLAQYRRDTESK